MMDYTKPEVTEIRIEIKREDVKKTNCSGAN